jgi:hypothetical protein
MIMAIVPLDLADWLKSASATEVGLPPTNSWGAQAIDTELLSPIALEADAQQEAARQALFLASPRVVDVIEVPGLRRDLLGLPITITADRGGYASPVTVFVIGYRELDDVERTRLTVLRRLP